MHTSYAEFSHKIMQVSQTFAEMMFKHGFVHCDPHAANLLIRPMPSGKMNILGEMFIFVRRFDCMHVTVYVISEWLHQKLSEVCGSLL